MAPKKTKKSAQSKKPKRSTKRAAKPTKDETVEVSTGVQLLLGGENMPKDEEVTRDFEMLARLMAKAATAQSQVREHKSKMKDKGQDVKSFTDTMALERMDPLDVAKRFQSYQRLFRIQGMPIQIGLFEAKYDSLEAQAKAEGYADGKAGRSQNTSRWVDGAPGHSEYSAAWLEAQAELAMALGSE